MKESDGGEKKPGAYRPTAVPEQGQEWQTPRLTIWEVAEETGLPPIYSKTGSGADSHGMREVTATD